MISQSSIHSNPASRCGFSRLLHHNRRRPSSVLMMPVQQHRQQFQRCLQSLRVRAVDAAEPNDCVNAMNQSTTSRLKIAIVGFEKLGQFLAKGFIRQGHTVLAHSLFDYRSISESIGAAFFSDPHELCEQHPDVMVMCTSVRATESVLRSLPLHRLRPNVLFVEFLSLMDFPKNTLVQVLPAHFDILCTLLMFGTQNIWQSLPFVFDKLRIGNIEDSSVEHFVDIFNKEGCRMVEMSREQHDENAIYRILEKLDLETKHWNLETKGYNIVPNTAVDSFDFYYETFFYTDNGIFLYNRNSMQWKKINYDTVLKLDPRLKLE